MIIWRCFHCGAEKVFATDAECDRYADRHYDENHAADRQAITTREDT